MLFCYASLDLASVIVMLPYGSVHPERSVPLGKGGEVCMVSLCFSSGYSARSLILGRSL